MVAEARTEHASLGTHTTYLFVAHCAASDERIVAEVPLDSLDDSTPTGEVIAWDWRAGTATRLAADASIHVDLGREEWTYHVLAPILSDGIAVIGDVTGLLPMQEAMAAHGYGPALMAKLCHENWVSLLERTWGE